MYRIGARHSAGPFLCPNMRAFRFATLSLCLLFFTSSNAQSEEGAGTDQDTLSYPRKYTGAGYPLQPSFMAGLTEDGLAGPVRFTPLCLEVYGNYDRTKHFGYYIGFGYRQVGYINTEDSLRMKFRTWNVALPIGIKLGNMQRGTFFLGYRLEWPFHYRERTFLEDGRILSRAEWFSKRIPAFSHGVEAGYQFRNGLAIRFEYYLNPFHRTSFQETVDDVRVKPYAGRDVHLIGISIIASPFKDTERKKDEIFVPPIEI